MILYKYYSLYWIMSKGLGRRDKWNAFFKCCLEGHIFIGGSFFINPLHKQKITI